MLLLCFFAPAVLQKEGLSKLVEHNNKKVAERQLDELKVQLTDMISGDPPASMEELLDAVKSKKAEFQLQDTDIIKVGRVNQAVVDAYGIEVVMTGKSVRGLSDAAQQGRQGRLEALTGLYPHHQLIRVLWKRSSFSLQVAAGTVQSWCLP